MVVRGRLDTHVYGHLDRYGETGVVFDLGDRKVGIVEALARELLVEVAVGAYIYHNHLEGGGILLCEERRKTLVQIVIVFGEEGYDDRDRGFGLEDLLAARVAETDDTPVEDDMVV